MRTRTRSYKVDIEVDGKQYSGTGTGCNMAIAAKRAMDRWRGGQYRTDVHGNWTKTKGPGFGTKPKEMIVKITRQ